MKNMCDFGFSPDEEVVVLRGAELYKTFVAGAVGDIERAFDVARAIRVLKDHNYGGGGQGAYRAALIQYGFINKYGDAIDASVRNKLMILLNAEDAARAWWLALSNTKRFGWTSPVTIAKQWIKSTKIEEKTGPGGVDKPEPMRVEDDPASWVGAQAAVDQLVEFADYCDDDDQRAIIGEKLTAAGYFVQVESLATNGSTEPLTDRVIAMIEDDSICESIEQWADGKNEKQRVQKAYTLVVPLIGNSRSGLLKMGELVKLAEEQSRIAVAEGRAFVLEGWALPPVAAIEVDHDIPVPEPKRRGRPPRSRNKAKLAD